MIKIRVFMLTAAFLGGISSGAVKATLMDQFNELMISKAVQKVVPQTVVDTPAELTALQEKLADYLPATGDGIPKAVSDAYAALTAAVTGFGAIINFDSFAVGGAVVNQYGILGQSNPTPTSTQTSTHPLPAIVLPPASSADYALTAVLQLTYEPDSVNTTTSIAPLATDGTSTVPSAQYFDQFWKTLNPGTLSNTLLLMDWNGTTPGLRQFSGALKALLSNLQSELAALAQFNLSLDYGVTTATTDYAANGTVVAVTTGTSYLPEAAVTNLAQGVGDGTVGYKSEKVLAWYNTIASLYSAMETYRKQVLAAGVVNQDPVITSVIRGATDPKDSTYAINATLLKQGLTSQWAQGLIAESANNASTSIAGWITNQLNAPVAAPQLR